MKKFIYIYIIAALSSGIANAFTNSLDKSDSEGVNLNNNFSNPAGNPYEPSQNNAFNPKEHTGFEQHNGIYTNPNVNDTRYNSNCQFGTCTPGGLNPNNK